MLFLQGTKDQLADLDHLRRTVAKLEGRATLELIDDADHAFHVSAKTGRKDSLPQSRQRTAADLEAQSVRKLPYSRLRSWMATADGGINWG